MAKNAADVRFSSYGSYNDGTVFQFADDPVSNIYTRSRDADGSWAGMLGQLQQQDQMGVVATPLPSPVPLAVSPIEEKVGRNEPVGGLPWITTIGGIGGLKVAQDVMNKGGEMIKTENLGKQVAVRVPGELRVYAPHINPQTSVSDLGNAIVGIGAMKGWLRIPRAPIAIENNTRLLDDNEFASPNATVSVQQLYDDEGLFQYFTSRNVYAGMNEQQIREAYSKYLDSLGDDEFAAFSNEYGDWLAQQRVAREATLRRQRAEENLSRARESSNPSFFDRFRRIFSGRGNVGAVGGGPGRDAIDS